MRKAFRITLAASLIMALLPTVLFAQREVLYEQYLQNPMAINPAFTGVREDFNMTLLLRRRWFSLPNFPITQSFAMDGTLANGRLGLGLQALNDRMSPYGTTGIYGSTAYHFTPWGTWKLSLGAQGGINVLPVYDPSTNTSLNRALGSLGVGAWLRSEHFYVGVSKPELLNKGFGQRTIPLAYRTPLYVMVGGSYALAEEWQLHPYALVVQESKQKLRVDLGTRLWYDEKIGVGASYRIVQSPYFQLSAEAQVSKNIRLGYLFNSKPIEGAFNLNPNAPLGIHELMLKFVPSPTAFHTN
ncbi:hypothetical protein GCM10027275_53430 [Rhabdobacter roseus]|uniref:Type IX secretion system PorP/SprF family membrane protein n=1 Tax=Rhabdobacter roseus TaxID=1655419 RepID=A0A840TPL6_9BACT|nr:type IX secretion system membrane protein PorP/SprF [Rhabdobacter roseus]MBB5286266.1 type IX secretion system PorP/SprF family membrane protein [Rhabdobacter roseus]